MTQPLFNTMYESINELLGGGGVILFMAMDDKTEKPTPKKRRDTGKKARF